MHEVTVKTNLLLILLSQPPSLYFIRLATKEKCHTAEYMFLIIYEVLKDVGTEKFYAIVTDNASAMVKSRFHYRVIPSDFSLQLFIACTKFVNWRFTEN